MMASFKYFAFGSNLCTERMQINNPRSRPICNAELKDYQMGFGIPGECWKGGAATLRQSQGGIIWGTVYEVHIDHIESLDEQESGYTAISVEVTDTGGGKHICRTYIMDPKEEHAHPSPQYLHVIITGAKCQRLPNWYIDALAKIETNKNKQITNHMKNVFSAMNIANLEVDLSHRR